MAKRFEFRLETVRRVRRQARDDHQRRVAEKVREVGKVEGRVAGFAERFDGAVQESRKIQDAGRLDLAAVRDQHLYRGWLRRQVGASLTERDARQAELAAEQAKLAAASRQLRVIEKLRQRRWSEHEARVRREEQAAMDEAAALGQVRRHCRSG